VQSNTPYRRALIGIALAAALGAGFAGVYYGSKLAAVGTAFTAKTLCSGVFVSHRDARSVLGSDLSPDIHPILRYLEARIDRDAREVRASLFGLAERRATYREGFGCVVGQKEGGQLAALAATTAAASPAERASVGDDLRTGAEPPPDLDASALRSAVDWAFSESDPALPRNTRAVVVVHDGQIVAERYADGFTEDTALIGWSMTKSVVNALVGILVKEGRLSVEAPALVPEWRGVDDPRRRITLAQLLHMTSGLEFEENYANPLSDVTYMLFGVPNAAEFAVAKPLLAEPGTRWSYSSGTSNILTHAIRRVVGEADYHGFPRRALFDRVGMSSAVMETDAMGTFIGSSFMYATARDWARFGLLYLQDGVWSGTRILPEGWVDFSRTPVPGAPDGKFGAHFWPRIPDEFRCGDDLPGLPADAFHAVGHEGQFVTVVPSRKLVLVRLGASRYPCAWNHQAFVARVLTAISAEHRAYAEPLPAQAIPKR
jgi:CubicO group peptidase (beta-lactamase class C family)